MTWLNNKLKLAVSPLGHKQQRRLGVKKQIDRLVIFLTGHNWQCFLRLNHRGVCWISPIDSVFTPLIPITTGTTLQRKLVVVITCWEMKKRTPGVGGGGVLHWQGFNKNCSSTASVLVQLQLPLTALPLTALSLDFVFILWWPGGLCSQNTVKLCPPHARYSDHNTINEFSLLSKFQFCMEYAQTDQLMDSNESTWDDLLLRDVQHTCTVWTKMADRNLTEKKKKKGGCSG